MVVAEAYTEYLQFLKRKRRNPKTVRNHMNVLDIFMRLNGERNLQELTIHHFYEFMDMLEAKDIQTWTYRGYCFIIRSFARFLKDEGLVDVKVHRINIPEVIEKEAVYLTREELERMFSYTYYHRYFIEDYRDHALVMALYSTGCRISELLSIDTNKINWERREVTIRGKKGRLRPVFFDHMTVRALSDYLEKRTDNSPALFVGHSNSSKNRMEATTARKRIKRICKELRIDKKISCHSFRHTFATLLLHNEAPLYVIQQLLGHSSLKVTDRYLHHSNPWLMQKHKEFLYVPFDKSYQVTIFDIGKLNTRI